MVSIVGIHGTSKTNADSIRSKGFEKVVGVRGTGVYFWKMSPYAMELAHASYKKKYDINDFHLQTNPSFVAINATLVTENDLFFDFTKTDNRLKLENYIKKIMEKIPHLEGNERITFIKKQFDLFFQELQKLANCIIKLILIFVPNPYPQKCKYPVDILGHPMCLVARDIDCIQTNAYIEGVTI